MRVLINTLTDVAGDDLDDAALAAAYAPPEHAAGLAWWQGGMVATVDGSVSGADGRSGSVNTDADGRVFGCLRAGADAVVVGAGTAREEDYSPAEVPIVLVSGGGEVPAGLREAEPGRVLMATRSSAAHLAETIAVLGDEHVLILGEDEVDLVELKKRLAARGLHRVVLEGGPSLLGSALEAGVVDELCANVVPLVVAGEHPRMTGGPDVELDLTLGLLLEEDGTLLARWLVG